MLLFFLDQGPYSYIPSKKMLFPKKKCSLHCVYPEVYFRILTQIYSLALNCNVAMYLSIICPPFQPTLRKWHIAFLKYGAHIPSSLAQQKLPPKRGSLFDSLYPTQGRDSGRGGMSEMILKSLLPWSFATI